MKNRKLILISFDAVSSVDACGYMQSLAHFSDFCSRGAFVKNVKSVFISNTYPAHTSIVTGVHPNKHSVNENTLYAPGEVYPSWRWYRKYIQTTTLYDEAKKAGFTTCSILWPVTAGASIKYNMPEIFDQRGLFRQLLKSLGGGSIAYQMKMFSCYHRLFKGAKQPDLDNFSTAVTLRTIEKYSPDLIMLHLTDVDTHKHIYGPDSKEAMLAVSRLDKRLGQIQAAVKSAGLEDVTNYIILGDHACLPVSRGVDPNEFVKDLSGNFHLAGGTAFLVLHNPEDKEKAIERMKTVIQSPENGIKRLLSKEEMNIGGFSKEYALGIEACDKVAFGNPKKGQHGYGLDRKDYETFYLAAGPDVNAGQYEGGCIVDIAPLATKLLKIAPWEMDGRLKIK